MANFKENNAFWVARVWPFVEHIALFQPVLPYPGLELSAIYFFWIPYSLRNILVKFQIFSQLDELVEPVQQVAWWQPCFINALHCFGWFALIRARN